MFQSHAYMKFSYVASFRRFWNPFIAEGLERENACRIPKLRPSRSRGRGCITSYTLQEGLHGSAGFGHVGFKQGSCFILRGSGLKNVEVKGCTIRTNPLTNIPYPQYGYCHCDQPPQVSCVCLQKCLLTPIVLLLRHGLR